MKTGDTVFFIETNNNIRSAEVLKIAGDFVTLRYNYTDPHYIDGGKHHITGNGGIRLRKSRVFSSKEPAEKYIAERNRKATII